MTERKSLVCVAAGLTIDEGRLCPIVSENGNYWEILLAGSFWRVNKRSRRIQGWKDGPRFAPIE